jgi:serine phosphatase RsbU (regulator of sigma subunit)
LPIAWNDDPPGSGKRIVANCRALLTLLAADAARRDLPTVAAAQQWHRAIYDGVALPVSYYAGEVRDDDERFPELIDVEETTISVCALPLISSGRRLGVLRFSFDVARLFDEEERRFVLALAAQAAQALDRAQLEAQRANLGRRLQRGLLPGRLPEVPGVEVAAASHTAGGGIDLGGTFYDVWALGPGCWAFAMGDAAGTGPEAAALSALVRFSLRALTVDGGPPEDALRKLNTAMLSASADEIGGERFCTLLLGTLGAGKPVAVDVACAGHPAPLVRRRDGAVETLPVGGTVLGILEDPDVGVASVALDPGDAFVVVTDGAVQARRAGTPFGLDGVRAVLGSSRGDARATASALEDAVLGHLTDALDDDLAALVLRASPD